MARFLTQRYSREGLVSLFLICAFPLHLWTLIMVFRDLGWLAERTNLWDAVGVASYGMLFALVESVALFLAVTLLGLLTPKQWNPDRRVSFLALLVLVAAAWGIISQLLFLWNVSLPPAMLQLLRSSDHPLRLLYAGALLIVTCSVAGLVFFYVRSKSSVAFMQNVMERLSLLTLFYLVFDLLGLVIVVIRNLN